MYAESPMRRIAPRVYVASRARFVKPGIYILMLGVNLRVLPFPPAASAALVEFPEQSVVYAKDQPEYLPLPAYRYPNDPQGRIICCWSLNWTARLQLLLTGRVWHQVLTFNGSLQPQVLTIDKPFMPRAEPGE